MVNYGKSMIYKLVCKDPNITDIYVGSTTNFSRRKSEHKSKCNNQNDECYNIYKYKFIRDNGGFENWDMILIENVSCSSKRELLKIERKYIDELKPSLNIYKSYITDDEIKIRNKEYNKKYYEENKEVQKEEKKEYLKKYQKKNKEYLNKYSKEYYENNKNEILQKQNEKINCEYCNCLSSKINMKKHQRTMKCKKFQFIED